MKTREYGPAQLAQRLLRALAVNRAAPLNFPSAFMGLVSRRTGAHRVRYEFDDGRWCRDAEGEINLPALCVLLDMALGGASRLASASQHRVATSHLKIQFTGASGKQHCVVKAEHVSTCENTPLEVGLSHATVNSGKSAYAYATGAFALIPLPPQARQHTYHWERKTPPKLRPLPVDLLEPDERQVWEHFEIARDAATEAVPFIDHFWCGLPHAENGQARLDVAITPHLGNRSGNVHGGILIGMAAQAANAAAPPGMRLSSLSSWFLSPGRGPTLKVRSSTLHGGRSTAVIRTEILGSDDKRVFEAVSQHVVSGGRPSQG